MKVPVFPSHRVLDRYVKVPEIMGLWCLNPAPDERIDLTERDEKLVYELRRISPRGGPLRGKFGDAH